MSRSADEESMVLVEGLRKRFGETEALRGLDLTVAPGTVCGLLGPNGAGKTTAVRILSTLIKPDGGYARVAGFDVAREPDKVRYRIGLASQYAAIDEKLSGRDNLRLFGLLYHLGDRRASRRADELLERFGLAEAGGRKVETYSGGMRRRLDLISSLIIAPPVLFLDEPTTGLDPASRNEIWDSVRELVRGGSTVLLTTQYLDEADHLADQIAVINRGTLVASGSPGELKAEIGDRIDVTVRDASRLEDAAASLGAVAGAPARLTPERRVVSVPADRGAALLAEVVRTLDRDGVEIENMALRQPTLDEVFLRLVGRTAAEPQLAANGATEGDTRP